MRILVPVLAAGLLACATTPAVAPASLADVSPGPLDLEPAAAPVVAEEPPPPAAAAEVPAEIEEPETEDDLDADADVPEEAEPHEVAADVDPALRYTSDVPDDELQRLWKDEPDRLGSISIGFVDEGRLMNGVQFPRDPAWILVSPHLAWATKETVDYVTDAIRAVREEFPEAPPLRVNQISAREGGWLRPHRSHQSGRDVDLGFYYPTAEPVRARERERHIDVALNWALIKALVTRTDVQMILVDRRVQRVIYDHALTLGEDRAFLDAVFRNGKDSLVKHARRHRDHFHVRFFNPRAQELGRRVAPLLAQRPEQNVRMHRVRSGDTLGHIARRYGSTVNAIMKANRMRRTFLSIGRVLKVPLRGPCTRCPVPPPVVVPPRLVAPPRTPSDRVALLAPGAL